MRNNALKILGVTGFAALIAGVTLPSLLKDDSPVEESESSTYVDSVDNDSPVEITGDIDGSITLPGTHTISKLNANVHSAMGVQSYLRDEETGNYDLRFAVALENYEALKEASFTRTVTSLDGTVIKAESTLAVDTVYTTLYDEDNVKWAEDLDSTKTYTYALYTLRNIPEASFYDAIVDVTFNGVNVDNTTVTVNEKANVAGVLGQVGVENVSISQDTSTGAWYAHRSTNTSATSARVPERVVAIKDGTNYVGEPGDAITELRTINGYGTFEGFRSLASVELPATIQSFGNYAFYNCNSLTTLTLPRDLTSIGSSAIGFGSSSVLTTIDYDAVALSTIRSTISKNVDVMNISGDVETLPQTRLFGSAYAPAKINYGGTEAEWAALLEASKGTSSSYTGGLDIDNVWCTDTVASTVTFHLGAATLDLNGTSITGDYPVTVISGKTVANIGKPVLEGQYFFGWSTVEGGSTDNLYDFSTPVTADLDLYATFGAAPAGTSFDNALELTGVTAETSIENDSDYPIYYINFTPETAGTYYLNITDAKDASGSDGDTRLHYYDETGAEVSYGNWPSSPLAEIAGSTNSSYSSTGSRFVRIVATAGTTYRFGLVADSSSSASLAGSLTFSITNLNTNDSIANALQIARNGSASLEAEEDNIRYYKYVAETSESTLLEITNTVAIRYYFYSQDPETGDLTRLNATSSSSANYVNRNINAGYAFDAVAGTTYYLAIYADYDVPGTSGYAVTVSFEDVPAGYTVTNPAAMPDSGTSLTSSLAQQYHYFTYTASQDGTYSFKGVGSTTSYNVAVTIYDAEGNQLGTASSSGTAELLFSLTSGTAYIIGVGYTTTSTSSAYTIEFTYGYVAAGSRIDASIGLTWENGSTSFDSFASGATYYSWTETDDGAGTFLASIASEDPSAQAVIKTSSSTTVATLTVGDGGVKFQPVSGTTYYVEATSSLDTTITLTKGVYVGPLSNQIWADGSTYFYGSNEGGSSTYRVVFGEDGFYWNGSSSYYEVGAATTDDNGNLTFSQTTGYGNRVFYVKGTEAWVIAYGNDFYFLSTAAPSSGISSDYATTSSATITSGTIIQSLVNNDGETIYAAMVDGAVYIGATVTFSGSATSIENGDFTLSYNGTTIGHYSASGGTLSSNDTWMINGDYASLGATNGSTVRVSFAANTATVIANDGTTSTFAYQSEADGVYTFTGTVGTMTVTCNATTFSVSVDASISADGETLNGNLCTVATDITALDYTATLEQSSSYPWTADDATGTYRYDIPSSGSSFSRATYGVIVTCDSAVDWTLTFDYDINTESGYDYMTISTGHSGSWTAVSGYAYADRSANSGAKTGSISLSITAGDEVFIGYYKDGSGQPTGEHFEISNLACSLISYGVGDAVNPYVA